MLLMLEDNADRIASFTATLAEIDPTLPLRIWRNAWLMIREVESLLRGNFGERIVSDISCHFGSHIDVVCVLLDVIEQFS